MKQVPSESIGMVSYSPSTVTMALSCITSDARYWSKVAIFVITLPLDAPIKGGSQLNDAIPFGMKKI